MQMRHYRVKRIQHLAIDRVKFVGSIQLDCDDRPRLTDDNFSPCVSHLFTYPFILYLLCSLQKCARQELWVDFSLSTKCPNLLSTNL